MCCHMPVKPSAMEAEAEESEFVTGLDYLERKEGGREGGKEERKE